MSTPSRSLRIGMAVHGRFHAFDLARGLVDCGHKVTLFTNYPRAIAEHFGAPKGCVQSITAHGIAARLLPRVAPVLSEPFLHQWFGGWAARQLARHDWDFTHVWSGVASEWLGTSTGLKNCVLKRGSAHIRAQRELLEEEEARVGHRINRPSDWMVEREEAEYARTPLIVVLSAFAEQTFLQKGLDANCVCCIPLAGAAPSFQVGKEIRDQRISRLHAREPLRLIFVGNVSYQKGIYDLDRIIRTLPSDRFKVRLVGEVQRECAQIVARLAGRVEVRGFKPEAQLSAEYEWADLLVLPSIQDGFGLVLNQASASGVPFIASAHSGGPDLVRAGIPGWVLPARAPDEWVQLLTQLEQDRDALIDAVRRTGEIAELRTWSDVAGFLTSAATKRLRIA